MTRARWLMLQWLVAAVLTLTTRPSAAQGPPAATPAPSAATPASLPPGHPPIDGDAPDPEAGPRAMGDSGRLPRDVSAPSPTVPQGTVRVTVRGPGGEPVAGDAVVLVALGPGADEKPRPVQSGTSDPQGRTEFSGLPASASTGYHVIVVHASATYASTPFRVLDSMGHRVVLHVYPATRQLDETQVAMRAFVFVEPRSDIFQFEVLFQIHNPGPVTWLPTDISLRLPEGAQAFTPKESDSDLAFAAPDDEVAVLRGTVPPGAHDVGFSFQVPNDESSTAHFEFALPPRVAEARVLTEAGRRTTLTVDGFPPATRSTNPHGQTLLSAQTSMQATGAPLSELSLTVGGLPLGNSGRWYALLAALALVVGGVRIAWASSRKGKDAGKETARQLAQARTLMLDELVQLHRARRAGRVGPHAFDTARTVLIDALARLELAQPRPASRHPRRGRARG